MHRDSTEVNKAIASIDQFLGDLGRSDLESAQLQLAPEVRMVFPGGKTFTSLEEMMGSSTTRYKKIDKVRGRYEGFVTGDGDVVVVSQGTLFGINLFDVAFHGVRYVDRFLVRRGLIVEQQVWNDLHETGVLEAKTAHELHPTWAPSTQLVSRVRRTSVATWLGPLGRGTGSVSLPSTMQDLAVSVGARKQVNASSHTSPEELLAAAHAACFAMSVQGALDKESPQEHPSGNDPIEVEAVCSLRIQGADWRIESLDLLVTGNNVDPLVLSKAVETAKNTCPISKVVAGNVSVSVAVHDNRPMAVKEIQVGR